MLRVLLRDDIKRRRRAARNHIDDMLLEDKDSDRKDRVHISDFVLFPIHPAFHVGFLVRLLDGAVEDQLERNPLLLSEIMVPFEESGHSGISDMLVHAQDKDLPFLVEELREERLDAPEPLEDPARLSDLLMFCQELRKQLLDGILALLQVMNLVFHILHQARRVRRRERLHPVRYNMAPPPPRNQFAH